MNILILGSGAREHALASKINQSPLCDKLFVLPGNPGTSLIATNVKIDLSDIHNILNFCLTNNINLVVVGSEIPLSLGITNLLMKNKIKVFGPSKEASMLETSKIFMKDLCQQLKIPTANGLAGGKGVAIPQSFNDADIILKEIMVDGKFGLSGSRIIIEEFLNGIELSYFVISDGENIVSLPSAQDHKKLNDGNKGPNTGGMGAYSPVPFLTPTIENQIIHQIINPTIKAMHERKTPFIGVLFAGIMLVKNKPYLLEYNARFGDPECQVILECMDDDIVDLMLAAIYGSLRDVVIRKNNNHALCAVIASYGYPNHYRKGFPISGLDQIDSSIKIYHAGTTFNDGKLVTDGGRVLCVADNLINAYRKTYSGVKQIHFDGCYYRNDIGFSKSN